MKQLSVHSLPEQAAPEALSGGTAVVIDVLRATTTIVYALAAGAKAVIPCLTIEDARGRAARFAPGEALLAGERGGLPIAGFDLGNSPLEFRRETVGGKTVVLTTTNGTKALLHCRQAESILVGAFANLAALCTALSGHERVDVVCAGTDGQATDEDVLVAGAIVARLKQDGQRQLAGDARLALDRWQAVAGDAAGDALTTRLVDAMRDAAGGRNLIQIGMDRDIRVAAELDRTAIVPRFEPKTGEIRASG